MFNPLQRHFKNMKRHPLVDTAMLLTANNRIASELCSQSENGNLDIMLLDLY